MTRRNSLLMTADDVEAHNARVRENNKIQREWMNKGFKSIDDELREQCTETKFIIDGDSVRVYQENMKRYAGGGKTAAQERAMADFIKKNPNATVARFRGGQCIVEKPVGSGSIAAAAQKPRMNKTEAAWAMILEARKRAGEILWYGFEAIKLRLADKTFLTPDFALLNQAGLLEFDEVKGFMRDDAAVKLKVAAEHFPFVFRLVRKKKGQWIITKI